MDTEKDFYSVEEIANMTEEQLEALRERCAAGEYDDDDLEINMPGCFRTILAIALAILAIIFVARV
jgi:hypothetical protein